jgi:hypothetical protein
MMLGIRHFLIRLAICTEISTNVPSMKSISSVRNLAALCQQNWLQWDHDNSTIGLFGDSRNHNASRRQMSIPGQILGNKSRELD